MVDSYTHCAVLGDPIAHSLSPVLHNAGYRALGLSHWQYEKIRMNEDGFVDFVHTRDNSWRGLSVTMPLKRTVMKVGVPQDYWSSMLGVANTVCFDCLNGGRTIRLYNTDVYGIVASIVTASCESIKYMQKMRNAVIIGSGNTASSAFAALLELSAHSSLQTVTVIAREDDQGEVKGVQRFRELCAKIASVKRSALSIVSCVFPQTAEQYAHVARVIAEADLLISTVPCHVADGIACHLAHVPSHAHLLDVVYDPRPSALLQAWRRAGAIAIGGEKMLLHQAVAQVRLMTSTMPETMQSAMCATQVGTMVPAIASHKHGETLDYDGVQEAMFQALREAL